MFSIVMKFVYNPVNLFQDQTPITFLINFLLLTFLLSKLPTTYYQLPSANLFLAPTTYYQLLNFPHLSFLTPHFSDFRLFKYLFVLLP